MATILVVDDEPDIRMLVRFTLGLDGHEVVEAASGVEALDIVDRACPDLIVLDVMMPELSGWDTLARLKAHADTGVQQVPVLMLTALNSAMDRAKGGIEGAVRYLAKPIAPDDLRASVTEALTGDPEPVQRRRARTQALEDIARIERIDAGEPGAAAVSGPRMRLTSLESSRSGRAPASPPAPDLVALAAALTPKQRELLEAVRRAPTVLQAASALSMSRSNVYASLRRIARRLGVRSVTELLDHVRAGRVVN
jgi:twitching motility two-component system response regulator PilH